MKEPNWLYCFAFRKQKVDFENYVGLSWYSNNNFNDSINFFVDLEREDVDEFTFDECLQYALGNLGIIRKYCDAFFNINKKD